MTLIWASHIPEVFHSSQKQIFKKNPCGSTLDGNLPLLKILKLKRETPGLKQLFKSKRVLNFHWFDECFIKMKQRFSILVEIQHFFGLTQPTNGFQILVNKGFQFSRLLSNLIFKHSLLYNTWLCFLKPWAESSHEFFKKYFLIRFNILLKKTISRINFIIWGGVFLLKEN